MLSDLQKAVHALLLERERTREICDLTGNRVVHLTAARIPWNIDFSFRIRKTKELFFCEAKGIEVDRYRLVKKLYEFYGQAPLEIWKANFFKKPLKPYLDETIIPKGLK